MMALGIPGLNLGLWKQSIVKPRQSISLGHAVTFVRHEDVLCSRGESEPDKARELLAGVNMASSVQLSQNKRLGNHSLGKVFGVRLSVKDHERADPFAVQPIAEDLDVLRFNHDRLFVELAWLIESLHSCQLLFRWFWHSKKHTESTCGGAL